MDTTSATANALLDLHAAMTDPGQDDASHAAKPFIIDNEQAANWIVRKIVEARAYGERAAEWAAAEKRRAEQEEERLMFLFGAQLRAWVVAELRRLNNRKKSIALPAGRIGFRHEDSRIAIDDEDVVLAWCRQHLPEAVKVSEKLMKSVLADHVAATGEIPEAGIHIEPAHDQFFIK